MLNKNNLNGTKRGLKAQNWDDFCAMVRALQKGEIDIVDVLRIRKEAEKNGTPLLG